MNMKNKWMEVPGVLIKRLVINARFIFLILSAGMVMEKINYGEGFLKLTVFCVTGFGIRLLYLMMIFYWKCYTVEDGVVTNVQQLTKKKPCYLIEMVYSEHRHRQFEMPIWNDIQTGSIYRCYWKNGDLLGIEPWRESMSDISKDA